MGAQWIGMSSNHRPRCIDFFEVEFRDLGMHSCKYNTNKTALPDTNLVMEAVERALVRSKKPENNCY